MSRHPDFPGHASAVIALLNSVYLMKIQGKFAIVSNSKFMWHVLRLPMSFFSQRMAGDIAMRQKANQDIASLLIGVFAPLIMDGVMMLSYLIIMARYSLPLTCIGVLSVLVHVWTAAVISSKRINIQPMPLPQSLPLQTETLRHSLPGAFLQIQLCFFLPRQV